MKKFDFVDSVRGFAIMWVVLVHTHFWIKPENEFLRMLGWSGRLGVQMFYVASAFTLLYSMGNRKFEKRPVLNYFIRRFFRIAPMFYLAIIVYTVFGNLDSYYYAPDGVKNWHILLTAFFMHGWHPESINSVVPGGWSIAVEMMFYILLPFIYHKLKTLKNILIFICLTIVINLVLGNLADILITPLYPPENQYLVNIFTTHWVFAQLPVFGIGFLVFYIFERFNTPDKVFGLLLVFLSLYLHIGFLEITTYKSFLSPEIIFAIVFGLFFLGLHFSKNPLFVNWLTRWIGKLSFSIYLTHFGVIYILKSLKIESLQKLFEFHMLTTFLIILAISSGISYLTYRFIELKGVDLGKAIISKLETNRSPGL